MTKSPTFSAGLSLGFCLFLAMALSACASTGSQFPVLALESDEDAILNCSGLEEELLHANALRDAIFEERGDELTMDILGGAGAVAGVSVIDAVVVGAALPGQIRQYQEYRKALIAAEERMIRVLTLRVARSCQADSSQEPDRTDQQILSELDNLQNGLDEGALSEQEFQDRRRELLDSVR